MKRFFNIMILALCVLILVGCELGQTPPETTVAETTMPQNCKVEFIVLEKSISNQTVPFGGTPHEVALELKGFTMFGWVDENGERVEPFAMAIEKDTVFTAQLYPTLCLHTPFLFPDADNCLRPDDALVRTEMFGAVHAMVDPAAKSYIPPNNISADLPVSGQVLTEFLSHFFPEQLVKNTVDSSAESITRAEFAVYMLRLLNFNEGETLTVAENAIIPTDIVTREDSVYLLEASVVHTCDDAGAAWDTVSYEPGFVNINGWLYYVKEDKTFLRNDTVNGMSFDAAGRYTCGDGELDAIVAGVLDTIIKERPGAERMDLLYAAFEYARDSFAYIGRNNHKPIGQTDWGVKDAKVMFTEERGNCYNYAAAFWALARGLGYDAQVMSGVVLKDRQDHGWVFMELDGQRYLCDPEWEMVYRYERNDYTKDMFMLTMAEIGWWNYDWTP